MKIRALKKFEGLRDNERSQKEGKDIYPKEGDVWEVTDERGNFLKEHGVVEIIEEKEEVKEEQIDVKPEETKEEIIKPKASKNKKRKK